MGVCLLFLQREISFMTSCLLSKVMKSFQNGATLKGKNFLLEEKIFPLRVEPY